MENGIEIKCFAHILGNCTGTMSLKESFVRDVLPYLITVFLGLTIIINFMFNMKIRHVMNTQLVYSTFARMLTIQFIVVDCFATLFIFIPSAVTSAAGSWLMSDVGCTIHGIVITWVYLVLFGLFSLRNIERFARIKFENWHKSTFDSQRKLTVISIIIWLIDLGVACVPLSGWTSISYDFYHSSCVPMLETNIYHQMLLLGLGLGLTVFIFVITHLIIYNSKGENKEQREKDDDSQEIIQRRKTDLERKPTDIHSQYTISQNSWISEKDEKPNKKGKEILSRPPSYNSWVKDPKDQAHEQPKRRVLSWSTFRHTTTTNFALCIIMFLFYAPYFALICARAICGTCIHQSEVSATLVFVVLTFTLRPIIFYLRLRRVIKEKSERRLHTRKRQNFTNLTKSNSGDKQAEKKKNDSFVDEGLGDEELDEFQDFEDGMDNCQAKEKATTNAAVMKTNKNKRDNSNDQLEDELSFTFDSDEYSDEFDEQNYNSSSQHANDKNTKSKVLVGGIAHKEVKSKQSKEKYSKNSKQSDKQTGKNKKQNTSKSKNKNNAMEEVIIIYEIDSDDTGNTKKTQPNKQPKQKEQPVQNLYSSDEEIEVSDDSDYDNGKSNKRKAKVGIIATHRKPKSSQPNAKNETKSNVGKNNDVKKENSNTSNSKTYPTDIDINSESVETIYIVNRTNKHSNVAKSISDDVDQASHSHHATIAYEHIDNTENTARPRKQQKEQRGTKEQEKVNRHLNDSEKTSRHKTNDTTLDVNPVVVKGVASTTYHHTIIEEHRVNNNNSAQQKESISKTHTTNSPQVVHVKHDIQKNMKKSDYPRDQIFSKENTFAVQENSLHNSTYARSDIYTAEQHFVPNNINSKKNNGNKNNHFSYSTLKESTYDHDNANNHNITHKKHLNDAVDTEGKIHRKPAKAVATERDNGGEGIALAVAHHSNSQYDHAEKYHERNQNISYTESNISAGKAEVKRGLPHPTYNDPVRDNSYMAPKVNHNSSKNSYQGHNEINNSSVNHVSERENGGVGIAVAVAHAHNSNSKYNHTGKNQERNQNTYVDISNTRSSNASTENTEVKRGLPHQTYNDPVRDNSYTAPKLNHNSSNSSYQGHNDINNSSVKQANERHNGRVGIALAVAHNSNSKIDNAEKYQQKNQSRYVDISNTGSSNTSTGNACVKRGLLHNTYSDPVRDDSLTAPKGSHVSSNNSNRGHNEINNSSVKHDQKKKNKMSSVDNSEPMTYSTDRGGVEVHDNIEKGDRHSNRRNNVSIKPTNKAKYYEPILNFDNTPNRSDHDQIKTYKPKAKNTDIDDNNGSMRSFASDDVVINRDDGLPEISTPVKMENLKHSVGKRKYSSTNTVSREPVSNPIPHPIAKDKSLESKNTEGKPPTKVTVFDPYSVDEPVKTIKHWENAKAKVKGFNLWTKSDKFKALHGEHNDYD